MISYLSWVVLYQHESEDEWVGHCVDMDVVSTGTSPEQALESVTEEVQTTVEMDVSLGCNPLVRGKAPNLILDLLRTAIDEGATLSHPRELQEVDVSGVYAYPLVTRVAGGEPPQGFWMEEIWLPAE
tara:strand:+ start:62088 stop:62468 length:381 start_codon:yes stop_codon:yes gene_type:complete